MFKYGMPDAILLTVPYTGTNSIIQLFRGLCAHSHIPDAHWTDSIIEEQWNIIIHAKVIITARDPYLSAIRTIHNKQENPIEVCANAWNICLSKLPEVHHFVFDVGCQESERLKQCVDVVNFSGIVAEWHISDIERYATDWAPHNESHSEHKTRYLETGELPEGYDWSLLDEAVEWYDNLLTNDK